jgi:hypothetical protein
MIGTRIGPYEITAKLGEGGMGVVYKAKDFQLGREVALKVLPEGLTADPERAARFEREARLLAQLNHPNIAQVYGFETAADGSRALVMELVEGPTLAERLEAGPLPFNESLSVSLQVAQALEEAHEKGIVHRDLKPQNIKASMEGKVKVLDFGLAKAMDPTGASGVGSGAGSPSQLAQSPTLTLGATQMGVILGTAAYMSPEQAKGLAVDKRADVWAFGVVLYEMLAGGRLFDGETVPETLAGVIRAEIDLAALPPETPPSLRRLLERCLERDPKRRLRDIGEARVLLERPLEPARPPATAAAPRAGRRERVAWIATGLAVGLAAWALLRPAATVSASPMGAVTRLHLLPPEGLRFNPVDGPVALSPDGARIAFRVEGLDGKNGIVVRDLATFDLVRLPETDGAYEPIWSPDGRELAYFDDHLKRVDAGGLQPPVELAPVRDARGASWGADGTLLYAPEPNGAIHAVAAAGGEARAVTVLDRERGETSHLRPQHLPGGERFLYLIRSERADVAGLYVGSLDGKLKKRILATPLAVRFAAPDLVLAVQGGRLLARRLDLDRLELAGEPRTLAEGVEYVVQFDLPPVSATANGRLVYHPPSRQNVRQLVRIDRTGKLLETIGEPTDLNIDLSPEGARLASTRPDDAGLNAVWIRDLRRGVLAKLPTEGVAAAPVWSPDGQSLAYLSLAASEPRLVVRPAAGGEARTLWSSPGLGEPIDWSPDGRALLLEAFEPGLRTNLLLQAADGSGPPETFVQTAANEHSGRFSPDGRFVVYVSDETGRDEIYAEPFPRTGARWLVSPRGGDAPRWSGVGLEILYVEPNERDDGGRLVAVPATARGGELELGVAVPLGSMPSFDYEPLPGGRELLVGSPIEEGATLPPILIDNWPALLAPR